jgi:hypothetical protein
VTSRLGTGKSLTFFYSVVGRGQLDISAYAGGVYEYPHQGHEAGVGGFFSRCSLRGDSCRLPEEDTELSVPINADSCHFLGSQTAVDPEEYE